MEKEELFIIAYINVEGLSMMNARDAIQSFMVQFNNIDETNYKIHTFAYL